MIPYEVSAGGSSILRLEDNSLHNNYDSRGVEVRLWMHPPYGGSSIGVNWTYDIDGVPMEGPSQWSYIVGGADYFQHVIWVSFADRQSTNPVKTFTFHLLGAATPGLLTPVTITINIEAYVKLQRTYIRTGGQFKKSVPYVRDGGVWKRTQPWIKVAGEWQRVVDLV